jgi:hypothetical protein
MSSGLFATPTPTPIGIPQADGSGFIDTGWLHASVTPTPNDLVLSDGSGHISPDWLIRGNFSSPNIFQQTDGTGAVLGTGIALTLSTQAAALVWAGPVSGVAAAPTFRALATTDIPSLSGVYQPINAKLTSISALANTVGWLHNNGAGVFAYTTPTKSDVGLGSVENTALSTWAGSVNLTTLGTIVTGVWSGTAIVDAKIASAATWNAKQAAITFGTGVLTALGVNIGSAGAPVLFNGALGTPTSGTLTNCTFPTLNQNTSGTAAGLSATLAVTSGGTGLATIASGKMLYASALNTFAALSTGNSLSITGGVLDTIQDIRAISAPTFSSLILKSGQSAFQCYNASNVLIGLIGVRDDIAGTTNITFYGNGGANWVYWNGNVSIGAGVSPTAKLHIGGDIKTADPSGGTAQPWKLGGYTAGVAVQAGKVRVEINGTPYDLLTA